MTAEIDMKALQRNTIDPFKLVFDIFNGKTDVDSWVKSESIRQADKTLNNRIGEFHQMLLGGVDGWQNLGTGDETGVDLKNTGNTIFIELKNKFNTVNGPSLKSVRNTLEDAIGSHPNSTAYWAFIISKSKNRSGEAEWVYRGKKNPRIKKLWGSKVYELVTGEASSLEQTWAALPKAICEVMGENRELNPEEKKKLIEFFSQAFRT
jgi:hypothetical protein